MSFPLQLNTSDCIQCGVCETSCPYGAIRMETYPLIDTNACQLCKSCVEACPGGALELKMESEKITTKAATSKEIWVLAELEDGNPAAVTFELLGAAHRLAEEAQYKVAVVVIGDTKADSLQSLIAGGADCVYLATDPRLESPLEGCHADVLAFVASKYRPDILLIGATRFGRGVSARVASRLHTGLTADCTELSMDPRTGNLLQRRPAFGGNLMATIETPHHRPQMASVRPCVMKALPADHERKGEVIRVDVSEVSIDNRVELLVNHIGRSAVSISDAPVLVAGGRGMQSGKNIGLLYELAELVGGTVAASRAAVEAGWLPFERQVGQTGQTVAPRLYIACGISGQIQHTAALSSAETIIAINNDPEAPIFRYAHHGFVGDVAEVLPQLIRLLRSDVISVASV